MNQPKPRIVNPESTYKTYCISCRKNNTKPIDELLFLRGIVLGLSGALSITCISERASAITKFPVDDNENIWCLIVPCGDGVIRIIFGPLQGVDETLNNLQNSIEERHNDVVEDLYSVSSIDQF